MKSMTKKFGAIVLALAMCFSLCCTAMVSADDDDEPDATPQYSITISNTTSGYTYSAYKIFDATVGTEGNVAYSIQTTNPWFGIITNNLTAVDGVYTTDCFVLTPTDDTTYTVTVKDGVSDDAIVAYFKDAINQYAKYDEETGEFTGWDVPFDANATGTGNGGSIVLDLDDSGAGYYFVTSTLGAMVTITTTDPKAEVIDKNTPVGNLKKTMTGLESETTDSQAGTGAMGDEVKFTVTADVPLYSAGDETSPNGYLVTDYEFDDEMTVGLEITGLEEDKDYEVTSSGYWATDDLINSWVKIISGGVEYKLTDVAYGVTLQLIYPSTAEDGTMQFDGFILSYLTIPEDVYNSLDGKTYEEASQIETDYPTVASIEIDYTAHLTDAVDYENVNHIDMYWHKTTFLNPNKPEYTGYEGKEDEVYVLELDLTKIGDGDESKLLAGAEFQLKGENLNKVVNDTTYTLTALTKDEYEVAASRGDQLWFQVNDESGISFANTNIPGFYLDVDPYVLQANDPDADLSRYVEDTQPNADPDYLYIAYTLTVTHNSSVQTAENTVVTGTTDENGKLTFIGLTVGDYTLTEIKAPDGYNLLPEDLEFTITVDWDETTGEPTFSLDETATSEGFSMVNGVVYITVDNVSGTELPGTGGIGTTIFYIIGGVLVVGAVVVLVTRRRMTREG